MDKYEKQFEEAIRAELSDIDQEHLRALSKFCQAVYELLGDRSVDDIVGGVLQWGPSLADIYKTPAETDAWRVLIIQGANALEKN